MAFRPHTKVVFGGSTVNENAEPEIWQCQVNVIDVGADGPVAAPGPYAAQVAISLDSWYIDADNGMSSHSTLDFLKVNAIGADGKYSDASSSLTLDLPGHPGPTAPTQPPILSVCLSWTSAKSRGPGSHGRIYPPNNTKPSSAFLNVAPAFQASQLQTALSLLNLLRAGVFGAVLAHPVIASNVNATNTVITGARVGNVVDVQRKRKTALRETYAAGPLV